MVIKTSVENTIPPLLNAYHVTRSVSRDKHKLEVVTSDDAFFIRSVTRLSRIKWRVNCGKYTLLFRRRNAAGTTHELSPTALSRRKVPRKSSTRGSKMPQKAGDRNDVKLVI